jgi:hypothetical protein
MMEMIIKISIREKANLFSFNFICFIIAQNICTFIKFLVIDLFLDFVIL